MDLSFEAFTRAVADDAERRRILFRQGRPHYVLLSSQFHADDLRSLFAGADAIRRMDESPSGRQKLRSLLNGVRVVNLFAQPSTRTCESFVAAAEKLGATARVLSDMRATSFA